jgi:predicted nucleotidyltransferase
MLNQSQVDVWLTEFVTKLREAFGERLVWVGHHGSWARGEPRPESDIDCMVVLDNVEDTDLKTFRGIIHSMPEANRLASGSIMSISELKMTPRLYMLQCFYGLKVLYGSIEGVVEPPGPDDLVEDVKFKADENLHAARHYLLYPHDLAEVVHKLKYNFKRCFYALQSWVLLTEGRFTDTKAEIIEMLDDNVDKEVIRVARDWYEITDDLSDRPAYYIGLLERWSRNMMRKLETFQTEREYTR